MAKVTVKIEIQKNNVTLIGGLCMFFKMLEKCDFKKVLEQCGLPLQDSNRGFNPIQVIYCFFAGILTDAKCFRDLERIRKDAVLVEILELGRAPGYLAYKRYFKKFTQSYNQRVFKDLFSWLFNSIYIDKVTLDLDSCKEQISSFQQGKVKASKGLFYHPIIAFIPQLSFIGNFCLKSDDTNFLSFLENTLERVNEEKVGLIRADSRFFSDEILSAIENRENPIPYIIACNFSQEIKNLLGNQSTWFEIYSGLFIAEKMFQESGWEKPRRIVMLRQDKSKLSKLEQRLKAIELSKDIEVVDDYLYSYFVTNMDLPRTAIYDLYRRRADSVNRIKEAKNDFSFDKFTINEFWANEACQNFIVMAYNLYRLFLFIVLKDNKHPNLNKFNKDIFSTPGFVDKEDGKYILKLSDYQYTREFLKEIWDKLDAIDLPFTL